MAGSTCLRRAQPTYPGSLITRMKGTFETGRRQPHLAWSLLGGLGLKQELTETKSQFLRQPQTQILLLWLMDGRKDDRRMGRQMEGGSYSEVTAYIHRTRNGSFQTGWLEATVESRVRLQYCQFCVVMNQVSENHEAGLKSEGISENVYLDFFGFTFFVSAFMAYSASHFYDCLQT